MSSKIRKKRSDTKISSIEKSYKVDFGVRSNMKLGNFLRNYGFPSLSKAIKKLDKAHVSKV